MQYVRCIEYILQQGKKNKQEASFIKIANKIVEMRMESMLKQK